MADPASKLATFLSELNPAAGGAGRRRVFRAAAAQGP